MSLVGYRGTGKTSVGRILASRWELRLVDTDDEIEKETGQTIAKLFAQLGEAAFRDLEVKVIEDVTRRPNCVLALGGGAVLREENRNRIGQYGPVLWLRASVDLIASRLEADVRSGDRRPNLTNLGHRHEIVELLEQRRPLYESVATHAFDTDGLNPEQVADAITARLSDGPLS